MGFVGKLVLLMELRGLEPRTSGVPRQRSPKLSYNPLKRMGWGMIPHALSGN